MQLNRTQLELRFRVQEQWIQLRIERLTKLQTALGQPVYATEQLEGVKVKIAELEAEAHTVPNERYLESVLFLAAAYIRKYNLLKQCLDNIEFANTTITEWKEELLGYREEIECVGAALTLIGG